MRRWVSESLYCIAPTQQMCREWPTHFLSWSAAGLVLFLILKRKLWLFGSGYIPAHDCTTITTQGLQDYMLSFSRQSRYIIVLMILLLNHQSIDMTARFTAWSWETFPVKPVSSRIGVLKARSWPKFCAIRFGQRMSSALSTFVPNKELYLVRRLCLPLGPLMSPSELLYYSTGLLGNLGRWWIGTLRACGRWKIGTAPLLMYAAPSVLDDIDQSSGRGFMLRSKV